jgi:hypothetical protein
MSLSLYTYTNDQIVDFWKYHGGRAEFFNSPYYGLLNDNGLFNEFDTLVRNNQLTPFAMFLQREQIINKIFLSTKLSMKYSNIGLWWYMAYALAEYGVVYNLMPNKTWVLNIPMEPFDVYLKTTLPEDPYTSYDVFNDPNPYIVNAEATVVEAEATVVEADTNNITTTTIE